MELEAMTYEQALEEERRVGTSRCSDPAAMAGFCESMLQILVGAVSPKLVWQGAMKRGMTNLELARLCHSDPHAVADLMWI